MWMSAQPVVSSYVSSMVRDVVSRDDIMQEVIAAVVENIEKYDPEKPFLNWVLGISRNQIGLYRRRFQRERLVFDEATVELISETFSQISEVEVNKLEFLRGCMDKLTERDRQICELRYEQNLKPASIAMTLGATPNTVSKALQRIRDQLRSCIEFQVIRASSSR